MFVDFNPSSRPSKTAIPSKKTKELIQAISLKKVYIRVCEKFFSRIDNHVRALKYINKQGLSKKEWLARALHEKLAKEKNSLEKCTIKKGLYSVLTLNEL